MKFANRVIFLGDDYRQGDPKKSITPKLIEDFDVDIVDRFDIFCSEGVDPGVPNLSTPKRVCDTLYKDLCPVEPSLDLSKKTGNAEEIKVEIEKVAEEGSIIGLDVRLFEQDEEKSEKNEETITMRLFYLLHSQGNCKKSYMVFLFSSLMSKKEKEEWKVRFKKIHPDFMKEFKIFDREKLLTMRNDGDEEWKCFFEFLGFKQGKEGNG
jgi:hypothetical protein